MVIFRSNCLPVAHLEMDMVIKTTVNKDTEIPGETTAIFKTVYFKLISS